MWTEEKVDVLQPETERYQLCMLSVMYCKLQSVTSNTLRATNTVILIKIKSNFYPVVD